jgi:hypothetical protein
MIGRAVQIGCGVELSFFLNQPINMGLENLFAHWTTNDDRADVSTFINEIG